MFLSSELALWLACELQLQEGPVPQCGAKVWLDRLQECIVPENLSSYFLPPFPWLAAVSVKENLTMRGLL